MKVGGGEPTASVCPCIMQDREPGPPFSPQKEGDQNLERMMGQMQASVLPCKADRRLPAAKLLREGNVASPPPTTC